MSLCQLSEGREEDFDNLPKFLSKIKSALKQSGGCSGLSIAIPASYWYLQHLISRRSQRLAFYTRAFTASSTGYISPGCLFDADGPAEPYTDAFGVMSNPEIMRKLGGKISSGDLDKTAAIKTLEFGSTQCLGSAMVWAISQDTSDGKFSKQLQEATGYKSKGVSTFNKTTSLGGCVFIETSESEANTDVSGDQCKWTNCRKRGKGCAENWSAVANQSSERLTDLMTDDTGCDDDEKRTFCCPDGVKHPTCKRHFYNVGHCIPGCGPTSGFEVASSKRSCSSGYAQTACCKGDTKGLDVYRQYKGYAGAKELSRDQGVSGAAGQRLVQEMEASCQRHLRGDASSPPGPSVGFGSSLDLGLGVDEEEKWEERKAEANSSQIVLNGTYCSIPSLDA
ncbi:chitinase [Fusarium sp. NRRL 25303]|nr:chitinase [Fusarium sp. NRRL 25303]